MNIVLFTHPAFAPHQSMPRFARLLAQGMRARGHQVEVRAPRAVLSRLPLPAPLRKWAGYADQYLVFPAGLRRQLARDAPATLYVFADQALGPWVPLVAHRPHLIHCHDFLAQRSALGEIPENPTRWAGRQYQAYIRRGYGRGRHFISVSQTTRRELHRFLPTPAADSEVVYNGLNQDFAPPPAAEARRQLGRRLGLDDPDGLAAGYLLHVGGNQWYKNRTGIIELYDAWRAASARALPLLLLGEAPSPVLRQKQRASPFQADVRFLSGLPDELLRLAYAGATALLYPSLAEGFGWPIAEAMAAGCPVITTAEAPMTEVGGAAAFYLPRRPAQGAAAWAAAGAAVVEHVVELSATERAAVVEAGLANAARFGTAAALDQLAAIYQRVLTSYQPAPPA